MEVKLQRSVLKARVLIMWMKYSESQREMSGQQNLPDRSGVVLGEWHCLEVADSRDMQADAQALWFFLVCLCDLGFLFLILVWFGFLLCFILFFCCEGIEGISASILFWWNRIQISDPVCDWTFSNGAEALRFTCRDSIVQQNSKQSRWEWLFTEN